MASHKETTRGIYPGFSDCAIWKFIFQRQFNQPDVNQQQLLHQQHVEAVVIEHLWWLLINMKFRHQH